MRKSNSYSLSLISILFTITASIGTLLSLNHVSAESRTVNAAVTVPEACTMTSTNTAPHTAALSPNTYSGASGSEYENGIGKTTLTVICNDSNGFAIYAIGYTDNKYEGDDHTKLIGQNTNSTIDTAVYTNNSTPSNWSMKVNKVTDSTVSYNPQNMSILNSFDSWHIVPATYTKVAQYHANTGSSVTDDTLGAKVETTYAAYIAQNQPADTYIGQVKYTMVHPYTEQPLQPQTTQAGCIRYYPNGSNVVGTMGCQSISNTDTSATLLASNFSRTGYGFAGWSNKFDYATKPNQEGIKFYGPQETITFAAGEYTGSNNGLSLYAIWVKSEGSLQDSTKVAQVCNRLTAASSTTKTLNSVTAFTDQRDNNTYAIAKLADGNCWMIENLRLDNSAALTITNTNNPLNDGTNVTLKHSYSDTDAHNTLSASQDPTATAWCDTSAASCDDQSMLFTGNTTNRASSPTANGVAMYSYGNYYNWYSATAGRGTYSFGTNNNSVAGDLCPAGWHLPIGGRKANVDVSDFWKLSRATIGADPANFANDYFYYTGTPEGTDASNKMRAYPNNFVYSGYVYGGSVRNRGSYGDFWSSTAYSSGNAYNLFLYSSYVYPGTDYNIKYFGRTVRCVAPGV